MNLHQHPKKKHQNDKLGFGTVFTDHMFVMDWTSEKGWYDPRIVPYGPIEVAPSLNVFHYAQSIFEGMKHTMLMEKQFYLDLNKTSNV